MNDRHRNLKTIDRILVVIDPDEELPGQPGRTNLLQRAARLARASDAKLELFFPCHDPSLDLKLFANREEVNREKERFANQMATGLAELALSLKSQNLDVEHEVRWDHPPADAILRKIDDCKPDLVIKHTRSPHYVLGLSQNTDWELIRSAPCHVWFVKEQEWTGGPVMTAIGNNVGDEKIIDESDRQVFRVGNSIAEFLGVENLAVHCFQVPNMNAYATYSPSIAGVVATRTPVDAWQDLAELHGKAIDRFAEEFDIDPRSISLMKGDPASELPDQARKAGAGLLVMGARKLGRLERALSPVAAEPVLAEAPCDMLFVREPVETEVPEAQSTQITASPDINLEMAIMYPEKAFKTPLAVAQADQLSKELRERLLEIWEMDAEAKLREEDEGGPVGDSQAGVLKEIQAARRELMGTHERKAG